MKRLGRLSVLAALLFLSDGLYAATCVDCHIPDGFVHKYLAEV